MPKIGAYLIKILQFPVSYLLYASKTHFEGYLRQFSFQSILHRELHFYIQADYLKALYAYSNQETLTDTIFVVSQTLEQEVMERLPLWENIESGALLYALKQIDERERYVFLARVLDKRPFDVIGVQLGLSYKGAAAVYYRAIRKLKKSIEGVNGYDI